MNVEQYLADDEVARFAQWFADELKTNSLSHREFSGIVDAFNKYRWPFRFMRPVTKTEVHGNTYAHSARALGDLSQGLKTALENADDGQLRQWCIAVVKWGGVSNGNVTWLNHPENNVLGTITAGCRLLGAHDDATLEKEIGRFNSGMSKIYSLILPNFIIYDSRVAAAMAWHVMQWSKLHNHAILPSPLRFPCMPAKEAQNCLTPKLRKPCDQFPSVHGRPYVHAQGNLRASWLLARVLELSNDTVFHHQNDPLRALEAALFMWGYDLKP